MANRATRALEVDTVLAALWDCLLTRHEASALRGRIQFAEGQASCHCGRALSAMMAPLCEGNGASTAEELTEAIWMLRDILAMPSQGLSACRIRGQSADLRGKGPSRPEWPLEVALSSTKGEGRQSTSARRSRLTWSMNGPLLASSLLPDDLRLC